MNLENLSHLISNVSGKDLARAFGLGPKPSDAVWPALGGFVAGCAVGTMFALLFAPKSGREMRSTITEGVRLRVEALERQLAAWETEGARDHAKADEIEVNAKVDAKAA
ncbi:YtxH domain-containing protein [Nannocystaceae bacterium ST9]